MKKRIRSVITIRYNEIKKYFYSYFCSNGLQLNHVFIALLLMGDILFWVMQMVVHGEWMSGYFIKNSSDTGMDYFNMLACLDKHNPYKMQVNYPPMCFLILKFVYRLIPTSFRGRDANGFYYRELMHAQIIYVLFMLIAFYCMIELIKYSYLGSDRDKRLFAGGIVFSGPLLFTLERGNLIIISFIGLLFFINLYDSEEKRKRWCAYLALSFSAAIKIYPALFGLLILYKKRYKEAIQTIIVGLVIFVAPCMIFGGLEVFQGMFLGMAAAADLQQIYGMGCNFSFSNIVNIVGAIGRYTIEQGYVLKFLVPFAMCSAVFICSKEEWQKIFAIALMCIWLPDFSYTYTLTLFILPFICFLRADKRPDVFRFVYGVLFIIILIPLCLPSMEYLEWKIERPLQPLTMSTLIENIAICLLTVCILIEDLCRYKKV